ncbi:hypothetical protein PFICI_00201 [Pestalotiopsis fici W106-1]|uniref:RelA/SpoT domain-containing protein n=1 Tax=Pestalotiopsis fici (strain W106-1 / CGMCC3.15140) TaxID=1229662 RepID=W3XK06_PESFW|nr:uncharacterized protein PFICI_00201 [Pestalotiopsis fici W106-1]ETS86373.1 hypothetical protein PFICI_00201 [Pestalotiopsis fici W106-1]
MAVNEHEFKELLESFDQAFRDMNSYLKQYEETVIRIIDSPSSGGLSSIVQHAPITHRIKKPQSALDTLSRRQHDRIELALLKKNIEDSGGNWESFCDAWHMRDKIHETEPFTSLDDMHKSMHDLIGLRISLYFPRDVEKVVDYFTKHEKFEVVVPASRKGGIAQDFKMVRKLMAEGEEAYEQASHPTFAGYKSTHMVIKLKDGIFPGQEHSRGAVIEVQIGTIIMHAWSQIEHDIIYKRLGNRVPSTEEKRLLDLINGIVTTGEVALEQLASLR